MSGGPLVRNRERKVGLWEKGASQLHGDSLPRSALLRLFLLPATSQYYSGAMSDPAPVAEWRSESRKPSGPRSPALRITPGETASHLDRQIYLDLRNGFIAASGAAGRNLRETGPPSCIPRMCSGTKVWTSTKAEYGINMR